MQLAGQLAASGADPDGLGADAHERVSLIRAEPVVVVVGGLGRLWCQYRGSSGLVSGSDVPEGQHFGCGQTRTLTPCLAHDLMRCRYDS